MKISRLSWVKAFICILAFFLCTSCGVVKRGTIPWDENSGSISSGEITYATPEDDSAEDSYANFVDESAPVEIQEMQEFLHLAYTDWKGTPYQLGGMGSNGIDCSAFMQVVFEDYLSLIIPRTTREQLKAGKQVSSDNLRPGDLIFFKTGRTSYHVGVMVNPQEFLHASTSNGVKISKLSHPFWQQTYLTTRKLF